MYHIKAWKRVEQALTACAEPFVAAGRELVLGRQNDHPLCSAPVRTIPRRTAVLASDGGSGKRSIDRRIRPAWPQGSK